MWPRTYKSHTYKSWNVRMPCFLGRFVDLFVIFCINAKKKCSICISKVKNGYMKESLNANVALFPSLLYNIGDYLSEDT